MPRNGSGTYTSPSGTFNPAVVNAPATAADFNTLRADYETAISNSIATNGETTVVANLPMAGFRHTGVGNASARTMYSSAAQIQDSGLTYVIDTGAADVYVMTLVPAIAAYAVGQLFGTKIVNANLTTTPTLAVNGLTAGTITYPNGSALRAGDLPNNAHVLFKVAAVTTGTPTWHLMTIAVPPLSSGGGNLTGALNEAKGADIASATTTDIGAATGNYLHITGTTTITGLGTIQAGTRRRVVFDGALLLTHNATSLILLTGANITTVAGDSAEFESEGSGNWRMTAYARKSGASVGSGQTVSSETGAVATGTTPLPWDDTIPQNTEGDQYLSLAITPISATSTLVIDVLVNMASSASDIMSAALFQDSTAGALAVGVSHDFSANLNNQVAIRHVMTSGTTSATTFKVRVGTNGAGTTTFNGSSGGRKFGGVMASSIVIREVI